MRPKAEYLGLARGNLSLFSGAKLISSIAQSLLFAEAPLLFWTWHRNTPGVLTLGFKLMTVIGQRTYLMERTAIL